jgi:hypothetical protein
VTDGGVPAGDQPQGRRAVGPWRPGAAQTGATIALVAAVATAMVLLLAQSAGAIHLGFLGPVA